jgi:pimeloyl-ACP methyl ester carboxylesterase
VATARVNGVGLYYEESGSGGEAVVFAPGLAWGTHLFAAQVGTLAARYRCVCFEARGQGRSEVTRGGYELDNSAVDLAGLIEHLGLAPCHLVGHSLGASAAVRVAIQRPALVRSLALVNATTDEDPVWDRILFRCLSYAVELFGTGVVGNRLMKTMFGKSYLTDPARAGAREEARQLFLSNSRTGIARTVRGWLRSPAVMDELPRVSAPALVIAGEEDRAVKPDRSRQTADAIPRCRFLLVPRCGHSAPVEAPEAVTTALAELFEEVRSVVPVAPRALERS